MRIAVADQHDLPELARLLWQHAAPHEQAAQAVNAFAGDLAAWWTEHADSHVAFVARAAEASGAEAAVVGMAWLALLPRPPRPGTPGRRSADLQSVFVVPEHRGQGIGAALVEAGWQHAARRGAGRMTVSSSVRAVPLYERLGFSASPQLLERVAE